MKWGFITANVLKQYFQLNTEVIFVAHALLLILVLNFLYDICCIFQDIGPVGVSSS